MDVVLVRVQPDGRNKPAAIERAKTVIGRQTGCHLRIRSGEVSREHCEIAVEEGAAVIRDRGSRNGTFVNGVKVKEKRLEAGDLIAVGPVVLLVQIGGQPESFDAKEMYRSGLPGASPPARPAKVSDQSPTSAGLMDGIEEDEFSEVGDDADESSVVEFDFDFEDEEEEQRSQPPL